MERISLIESGELISDQGGRKVVKIDDSTIVKYGTSVNLSEAHTMIFIYKNTKIPVPKILDFYKYEDKNYIFMEYIKGETLDKKWKNMDQNYRLKILLELKDYIDQLRNITNSYIGSINNLPCNDSVFNDNKGPFKSEIDFNKTIMKEFEKTMPGYFCNILKKTLKSDHSIVFSHGDISKRNIIINEGSISSIIDWEYSGFYPEYWEYSKVLYAVDWEDEWLNYIEYFLKPYYNEFIVNMIIRRILW